MTTRRINQLPYHDTIHVFYKLPSSLRRRARCIRAEGVPGVDAGLDGFFNTGLVSMTQAHIHIYIYIYRNEKDTYDSGKNCVKLQSALA